MRYGTVRHGTVEYRYGTVESRYGTVVRCATWQLGTLRYRTRLLAVRCGTVGYGGIRYGTVRYGALRGSSVRYGAVERLFLFSEINKKYYVHVGRGATPRGVATSQRFYMKERQANIRAAESQSESVHILTMSGTD